MKLDLVHFVELRRRLAALGPDDLVRLDRAIGDAVRAALAKPPAWAPLVQPRAPGRPRPWHPRNPGTRR